MSDGLQGGPRSSLYREPNVSLCETKNVARAILVVGLGALTQPSGYGLAGATVLGFFVLWNFGFGRLWPLGLARPLVSGKIALRSPAFVLSVGFLLRNFVGRGRNGQGRFLGHS